MASEGTEEHCGQSAMFPHSTPSTLDVIQLLPTTPNPDSKRRQEQTQWQALFCGTNQSDLDCRPKQACLHQERSLSTKPLMLNTIFVLCIPVFEIGPWGQADRQADSWSQDRLIVDAFDDLQGPSHQRGRLGSPNGVRMYIDYVYLPEERPLLRWSVCSSQVNTLVFFFFFPPLHSIYA